MASRRAAFLKFLTLALLCVVMTACAGMQNNAAPSSPQPPVPVTIALSPTSATLTVSKTQQFQVTVAGATDTSVTWAVDGTAGGNTSVGSISTSGLYTAPSTPGNHTVTVTSAADVTKSANASVSVNPVPPPPPPPSGIAVLTERYDLGRTGQNLAETILKPGNVNSSSFGKIASYSVDGVVYAQPLYVSNLSIAGHPHNVVFVATENDSVYAFDADANPPTTYWQAKFINPSGNIVPVPTADVGSTIFPQIGITGTPVIDLKNQVMYLVVYTKENGGQYFHRLHAIDITTGNEKNSSPVLIQGSVPGTSDWNSDNNGNVVFDSQHQLQRPGLLLSNGVVYIAFGSHGDNIPYHGWIMAYDEATLQQLGIWNVTPNGHAGAIWQGGTGLSADGNGNLYTATANGDFGLGFGPNASDSVLKLSFDKNASNPTKAFSVADYFTPDNQQTLAQEDNDLGSSGFMLIPGTHLGVVAGKEGSIYLLDTNQLGHYNTSNNNNAVQFLPSILGDPANGGTDENFSTASYFNGNVYYIGDHDTIKQFAFNGNQLSNAPIGMSPDTYDELGAQAVISANGTNNAILWAIEYVAGGTSGELRAYDANDVSRELYTSPLAGFGGAVKFSVPIVVNGKVYVGTQNKLVIFANQ
jgi:hypothetical protein